MKKINLILVLALIANFSFSQEMKTLFSKDTAKGTSYGGYGAPMVGMGMINNNLGVTIGAKGGMIKNHKFGIGGIGGALIGSSATNVTDTIFRNDTASSLSTHNMTMGYGGIFIEYIFNYTSPIHISLPLNIEAGGIWAAGKHSPSKIKNSSLFIVEPGINIEFNFYKNFIPCLNIGYRFAAANSTETSKAASGLNVGLLMKIGKF